MKKIMTVIVGLAAMLLLAAPVASAQTTDDCTTYTTEVSDRPDSGHHGDWATDTFTRTTVACANEDGTWTLTITDQGTFTTLADATSPGAGDGVTLPATPITGDFTGGATAVVTVAEGAEPQDPAAGSDGQTSTSGWASLVFPGSTSTLPAWSWTYATDCETWTNGLGVDEGDVTGKECPPETTTTTPPPPASSSATQPPASSATSSRPAAVGSDDEQELLAATGTGGSVLPWLIVAGVVLLGGGGAALVIARRRKGEHQ